MKKAIFIIGIVLLIGVGVFLWHSCSKEETPNTPSEKVSEDKDKLDDEDSSKKTETKDDDGFPEVEQESTPSNSNPADSNTSDSSKSDSSTSEEGITDADTSEDDNENEGPSFSLPLEKDTGIYSPGIM